MGSLFGSLLPSKMAHLEQQRELRAASTSTVDGSLAATGAGSEQLRFVRDLRLQFQRRRRLELSACAAAFGGVLLMLAQNELLLPGDTQQRHRQAVEALKWLICLSTVALVALVLLQFAASARIARMQSVLLVAKSGGGVCSARVLRLALELLICGFHVPPGVAGDVEIAQFHSRVGGTGAECPATQVYRLERRGSSCYLVYKYPVEAFGVCVYIGSGDDCGKE